MLRKLKRAIGQFFSLSKSEQRGNIILAALILLVAAAYYLLPFFPGYEAVDYTEFEEEIAAFRQAQQKIRDSIRIEKLQNAGKLDSALARLKINPFPFNPNQLAVEEWRKLGLTNKQIQAIRNYEAKGGKFRKKEDLKKMYTISDAEYQLLEPYIRLSPKNEKQPKKVKQNALSVPVGINSADSAVLAHDLGLAPWLAARIVKYRNLLGGFYTKQQLTEVYGFDDKLLSEKSSSITVDSSLVRKLNLNKASFKQLLRHPYISYELTQYIVNTRSAKGRFSSIDEINEAPLVDDELFARLKHYLKVAK